jgi:hypothetical protein
MPTASIFLSYNKEDKPFARRLADDIRRVGITVWLDEAEIKPGDSIIEKIEEGLNGSEYIGVILSPTSVKSRWVKRELRAVLHQEITASSKIVLPLLYQQCEIPRFLVDTLYVDFTNSENYSFALRQLLHRLDPALDAAEFWPDLQEGVREDKTYIEQDSGTAETVVDADTENVRVESPRIPSLSEVDTLVLRLACEAGFGAGFGPKFVGTMHLSTRAEEAGVTREELIKSLKNLDEGGYIKIIGTPREKLNVFSAFSITAFGFDEFAKAFIGGYEATVEAVTVGIVEYGAKDNFFIREETDLPQIYIDYVLEVLDMKCLVELSRHDDGKIEVSEISPELQRRVKAAVRAAKKPRMALKPCVRSYGDIFNLCFILSNEGGEDAELLELEAGMPKHILNPNWSRDFDQNVIEKRETNVDGKSYLIFRYKVYEEATNGYYGEIERLPRIFSPSMEARLLRDFWFSLKKTLSKEELLEHIRYKVTAKGIRTGWETMPLQEVLKRKCEE